MTINSIKFCIFTVVICFLSIMCTDTAIEEVLRPPISEPIQAVCLNKVGTSIFTYEDQNLKQGDVYRFRYDSPDNCSAKFLGTELMVSQQDTLCLCEESQVGNAYFVLDSIEQTGGSLLIYHWLQGRETFRGVYNNDAVCDRYQNSNFYWLHMETFHIGGAYNLGDSIGLGFN